MASASATPSLARMLSSTAVVIPTISTTAIALAATPSVLSAGTERTDSFGIKQVYVPAGCFMMSGGPIRNPQAQTVCITQNHWLDEFDVTNSVFGAFVKADGYSNYSLWSSDGLSWKAMNSIAGPGTTDNYNDSDCSPYSSQPDQPKVCVNDYEAEAYAKWRGCRLPTNAEWEYAERGPNNPIYPWGNSPDPDKTNTGDSGPGKTTVVGAYPAGKSWVGAYDMIGNVWQWTSDWFGPAYFGNMPKNDPTGPAERISGAGRSLRGGSWYVPLTVARSLIADDDPSSRRNDYGFRVICSAPAVDTTPLTTPVVTMVPKSTGIMTTANVFPTRTTIPGSTALSSRTALPIPTLLPTTAAPSTGIRQYPNAAIRLLGTPAHYYIFTPASRPPFDLSFSVPGSDLTIYQTLRGELSIGAAYPDNQFYMIGASSHAVVAKLPMPLDDNGHPYVPNYSPSRRYDAYVSGHDTGKGLDWLLNVTDNQTRTQLKFSGTYIYDINNRLHNTLPGDPVVMGWNSTETALIVAVNVPNANSGAQGYYLIDLPGTQFTTRSTPIPLPGSKLLVGPGIMELLISPDGRHAAYLAVDPTNPPQKYLAPNGPEADYYPPFNTVHVIDLTTLKDQVVANAAAGGGVNALSWTPDGQSLYFMAGAFANTFEPTAATVDSFNLSTRQVTTGWVLVTNPAFTVPAILACDGSLYYSLRTATNILYRRVAYSPSSLITFLAVPEGQSAFFDSCIAG